MTDDYQTIIARQQLEIDRLQAEMGRLKQFHSIVMRVAARIAANVMRDRIKAILAIEENADGWLTKDDWLGMIDALPAILADEKVEP